MIRSIAISAVVLMTAFAGLPAASTEDQAGVDFIRECRADERGNNARFSSRSLPFSILFVSELTQLILHINNRVLLLSVIFLT